MSNLNNEVSGVTAFALCFGCLLDGPCTVFELIEESGIHENTARKLLRILKRHKRVHIAAWENDSAGRAMIAAYALGDKPDVKRRPRKTPTQRSAARRARLRLARLQLSEGPACVFTV